MTENNSAAIAPVVETPPVTPKQMTCDFCDLPIAPGQQRSTATGGLGHEYESQCIHVLRAELEKWRANCTGKHGSQVPCSAVEDFKRD